MLVQRWLTLVLCFVVGVGAALGLTLVMTPQYQATAGLYMMARNPDSQGVNDVLQGSNYARQAVLSYVQVVYDDIVLAPVIKELGLDLTEPQLASKLTVRSPTNTVLIRITATDTDPVRAANIANAVAQSLGQVVMDELEKPDRDTPGLVKMTQTQQAIAPTSPSSPRPLLNLAIGVVAGLAVGVGLAWLRSVLDTRVRSAEDLRNASGAPLLGVIPFDSEAAVNPLAIREDPHSPSAEEYRGLRTNVLFSNVGGKSQCLLVSSPNPADGKTTTAANLAIALADSGRRVILIDGDLRRPRIASHMRIEGGAGLSDILIGRVQPIDALHRWGTDNLYILPAGRTPPNPSELLGSAVMQELIGFLRQSCDDIIVDSPPILVATDTAVLSKFADGVILVASYESTRRHALAAAVNGLNMVGSRLLGVVLTKVPPKKVSGRGGYGYGYGYGYGGYSSRAEGTDGADATAKVGARS
jgi:capsular exopolysaccharide synthesis family protein